METHKLSVGAKLEKVYHVFRSYGGFPYFEKGEDEYVFEILNPENQPLILSRFLCADGRRVIMLVNNSQTKSASVTVVFHEKWGISSKFDWLAPGAALFIDIFNENGKTCVKDFETSTRTSNCQSCSMQAMNKNYPVAELAGKLIRENLSLNYSIADIASLINVDEYYLMHLFKKQYGESIVSYRNNLRMEKARKMLLETDKKIIEISLECGFENVCYFSRMFKEREGLAPAIYRERNQNK